MVKNLSGLIYPRRINSSVQVFELMRIMAFFWVVFAHEFAYRMSVSQNFADPTFLDYTKNSWGFTIIETGFYAVDIFLFIGGYVSILANTKYISNFGKVPPSKWAAIYVFAIFKRYVRIMPAYIVMMLFYWKVSPALTYGPFIYETHLCTSTTFWSSWIIGWNASITKSTLCTGWCWYLAVDF
jgi:peptidoglycan/LPS O-acetylase OafA/YrhL